MINLSRDFIGNNDLIKSLFKKFNNNKLSNSLILSGQKGVGKTTLAFCLVNSVYKLLSKGEANNTNLIYNNSHPNIRYIQKKYDDKTNKFKKNISIDQIRDLENFLNKLLIKSLLPIKSLDKLII